MMKEKTLDEVLTELRGVLENDDLLGAMQADRSPASGRPG